MENLENIFKKTFNSEVEYQYFSPGRMNLIGEHIDYNGGLVMPCAITLGTRVLVSKRSDKKISFYSLNMQDEIIDISLDQLDYNQANKWTNYPKGIFFELVKKGFNFDYGLNILYYGTIPYASGLSSSASILMATAVLANDIYNLQLDRLSLVKLTKSVENNYIGVNTGIMDQFIIGFAKKNHAILLDTNTLDFEYIPLNLGDNSIIIMNTNKKRGLADSKYNERKNECDLALEILKEDYDIKYLCDLNLDQLTSKKSKFKDEIPYRRAYHAISENIRTKEASVALKNSDLELFGKLMVESHNSLRDEYEVTGVELDTLVNSALKQKGVIGARVTGAGFGGCAIAIVNNKYLDNFIENVKKDYLSIIGYSADLYIAQVGDSANKI